MFQIIVGSLNAFEQATQIQQMWRVLKFAGGFDIIHRYPHWERTVFCIS